MRVNRDGFGNDRTDATRPCEPGHRDEQMDQEDDNLAHRLIVAKRAQNGEFWALFNNAPPTPW
jgi:hypothetical protein